MRCGNRVRQPTEAKYVCAKVRAAAKLLSAAKGFCASNKKTRTAQRHSSENVRRTESVLPIQTHRRSVGKEKKVGEYFLSTLLRNVLGRSDATIVGEVLARIACT